MAGPSGNPRQLSDREAETLAFMLSGDDPRLEPLREQARTASAVDDFECSCASINLAVDRSRGEPATLPSPAADAYTTDRSDPATAFDLILFLDGGWLSSLEIVHHGAVIPAEFPPAGAFEPAYYPSDPKPVGHDEVRPTAGFGRCRLRP